MLVLLVLFANAGEVVDRSGTGFTSRNIVHVDADANTVYRVLAENVDGVLRGQLERLAAHAETR